MNVLKQISKQIKLIIKNHVGCKLRIEAMKIVKKKFE